jgi:FlaA1/EpsC-like NDP-sugar epimerase
MDKRTDGETQTRRLRLFPSSLLVLQRNPGPHPNATDMASFLALAGQSVLVVGAGGRTGSQAVQEFLGKLSAVQ